jgi:hypothetical protein
MYLEFHSDSASFLVLLNLWVNVTNVNLLDDNINVISENTEAPVDARGTKCGGSQVYVCDPLSERRTKP